MAYQPYPSDKYRRCIYFNPKAIKLADGMAKAEGVSRSQIVSRAMEFYATNYQRQA